MLDIDSIEKEASEIYPRPWEVKVRHHRSIQDTYVVWKEDGRCSASLVDVSNKNFAEFIVHSHTNVPALCAELRKYRAAYEQLAEYAAKALTNVKEGGTTLSHSLKDELMARFLEAKADG